MALSSPSYNLRVSSVLNMSLWVVQIMLFTVFVAFGAMKLFLPVEKLAAMWVWPGQVSPVFLRLMGLIDAAGGIGVLVPALTRIHPRLTIWASLGCTILQVSAIIFHVIRGEAMVIPLNITLLILSVFILWGRSRKVPIKDRS